MMLQRFLTCRILPLLTILFLASCQRETDSISDVSREIKFTASLALDTKVTATSFEEGDLIGLSVGDPLQTSRTTLRYAGGNLTPDVTLCWPESMPAQTEVSFWGWYPFGIFGDQDPKDGTVYFTLAQDQYRDDSYERSDLLAAVASASPAQESVNLRFHHMLSRFVITVDDRLVDDRFRGVQGDDVRSVVLSGLKRQAGVNLAECSVEAMATSDDPIYPNRSGARTYCALVVPQSATPQFVLTLNSGKTLIYSSSAPITFQAGKQLSATLTLTEDKVFFQWDVADWDDAAAGPVFVPAQAPNEIWYTSSDGQVVDMTYIYDSRYAPISNVYENGRGVMKFKDPLTRVGDSAFNRSKRLTSVSLPSGITRVDWGCFMLCENLESIQIPEGVTFIGASAFSGCTKLSGVVLPEGLETIDDYAFNNCSSLTSIRIPSSVSSYGSGVFNQCAGLDRFEGKFVSPDGHSVIVNNELRDVAPGGLASFSVPDGVEIITQGVFTGCKGLSSIILPASVTEIGAQAFSSCTSLTCFHIPDAVTSIKNNAFVGCSSLESFSGRFVSEDGRCIVMDGKMMAFAPAGLSQYLIPDGVTTLMSNAFSFCTKLATIGIPHSVTRIEMKAFASCSSLKTLTIPEQVSFIGADALYACNGLEALILLPVTPPDFSEKVIPTNCPIYVSAVCVDTYKSAPVWSTGASLIQSFPVPGHVDMGLPSGTQWASCNLGAGAQAEAGYCFAWGEFGPKGIIETPWYDYRFGNSEASLTKYTEGDGLTVLDAEDDAAIWWLGADWRMPTYEEVVELYENCTFTQTSVNGVAGYEAKSLVNGNTLFFPLVNDDPDGVMSSYWTSTLCNIDEGYVLSLFTDTGDQIANSCGRYSSHPIRPVYVGE